MRQGRLGLEEESGDDFGFADGAENLDTQIEALHWGICIVVRAPKI